MQSFLTKALALAFLCLASIDASASTIPDYKHETVQRIFNDLKAAKGIFPHEEPKLVFEPVFSSDVDFVFAYIDYAKSEIHLEEFVYDVCVHELGKDSLNGIAFMLGHELSHFLNRHDNVAHHTPKENEELMGDQVLIDILKTKIDTMNDAMLLNISKSIRLYNDREGEATADLEGGFITYLAGYGSDRIRPTLPSLFLSKVYAAFGVQTDMKGYPTLQERQAIASSSKVVLDSLIHLYEMANALASIEHYEEAMTYYEILTRTFESREIYNNMGVNAFLDATKCFQPDYLPRNMPITLDVDSRMEGLGRGNNKAYDDEVRKIKLGRAIRYFEKSAQMDNEYPIALLNLSVTRLLKAVSHKEPVDSVNLDMQAYRNQLLMAKATAIRAEMSAKELIEELKDFPAQKKDMKNVLSNIYVQLASIAEQEGKQSEKNNFIKKARNVNSRNIFLANVTEEPNVGLRTEVKCQRMENGMPGKDLLEMTGVLANKWSSPIRVKSSKSGRVEETQTFQKFIDGDIIAYNHEAKLNSGEETLIMLIYQKKKEVESVCGIKKGSTLSDLTTAYGKPVKYFAVTGGSYFVYDRTNEGSAIHNGVVFYLNKANRVKSYFSYLKMRK